MFILVFFYYMVPTFPFHSFFFFFFFFGGVFELLVQGVVWHPLDLSA